MPTIGAILQDADETVREATRTVGALAMEVERLRELLNVAREGLCMAVEGFNDRNHKVYFDAVRDALRRSDPDATPATETGDGTAS